MILTGPNDESSAQFNFFDRALISALITLSFAPDS